MAFGSKEVFQPTECPYSDGRPRLVWLGNDRKVKSL
uniref:Uncharacterized protein n=1 Tax=Anguilla anguilla TaxID=7936 RepID=A0A0E9VWW4_ANGAN